MTLILAVETSTRYGGVALMDNREIVGKVDFSPQKPASEMLLPSIKEILECNHLSIQKVEMIAVSNGPGSFTGLRVGLTTAKTLAFFLEIPVVSIPTLDGIALPVISNSSPVLVIQDARKGEVYFSLYSTDSIPNPETPYAVGRIQQAFEKISICKIVGDALYKYEKDTNTLKHKNAEIVSEKYWRPDPVNIGHLACSGQYEALSGDDLFKLTPIYVRLPEAEIQWRKKQLSE